MNERTLWSFIAEHLRRQKTVMLAAVADYEKGSPGKTGFKLCIGENDAEGTIGGGIMEFNIIKRSRELLASKAPVRTVKKLVHNPNTVTGEPSGLICAGSQTVCMISLGPDDAETVNAIISALTWYAPSRIILSPSGLSFAMGKGTIHAQFQLTNERNWQYAENIGPEYTAYVVGGGHVGKALARVLQMLEFSVAVIDDRADAPAFQDESLNVRKIVASYETAGSFIDEGMKSFVAIVTSAVQSDRMTFQSILEKELGYVGLMGTPAKISRILNSFSAAERGHFRHLHAPIGMSINSRTVEEIAVSIAAQMIAEKNKSAEVEE